MKEHSLPLQRYFFSACLLYGFQDEGNFNEIFRIKEKHRGPIDPHVNEYRMMFKSPQKFKDSWQLCRWNFEFALLGWKELLVKFKDSPNAFGAVGPLLEHKDKSSVKSTSR